MRKFTVKETNICKGVACMLLLMHHLFWHSSRWGWYHHIFGIEPPLLASPAAAARVCVAIFVMLSGYGLTKSAAKKGKPGFRFTYRHMVNLMFQFWFIFIVFVPLSALFGRFPADVYGAGLKGAVKCVIDFLGIANLCHTPSMNGAWWYMGAAILLYLMFPLLYRAAARLPYAALAVSALICFFADGTRFHNAILAWIFPFVTGIYLADRGLLERIINYKKPYITAAAAAVCCAVFVILRQKFDLAVKVDTFFGLGIIVLTTVLFSQMKYVSTALGFIGIHSANIFMMHTFIYYYYFREIIYSLWYPILIHAALLLGCLLISVGLEKLKKLVRYDKLQGFLLSIGGN